MVSELIMCWTLLDGKTVSMVLFVSCSLRVTTSWYKLFEVKKTHGAASRNSNQLPFFTKHSNSNQLAFWAT